MDPSLFIDEVPSHFLCCVCFNVVEDPVEHTDCDNIFCSGCSSKLLSHQSSCPLCRGSLKQSKMRPLNRILKGQYDSLKMMCLYAANGCGSKFTIAEKACHEAICNHHYVQCQYCQDRLKVNEISNHESTTCRMYPVPCPVEECDVKSIPRQMLEHHLHDYGVKHVELLQATIKTLRQAQPLRREQSRGFPPCRGALPIEELIRRAADDFHRVQHMSDGFRPPTLLSGRY